jgi:hypothetical protein
VNRVQRVRKICAMYTEKEGVSGMSGTKNYARYTKSGTVPDVPTKKYFTHIYIHLSVY